MPWIKVISYEEAEGKLKEVYNRVVDSRGKVSNIMSIHSLFPESMEKHLELYITLMFRGRFLKRDEAEMLGVYVSIINKCEYCIRHHSEALKRYWDSELVDKFVENPDSVELPDRKRLLLKYAEKLTRKPYEVSEEDVAELKRGGFRDEEILHANLIISYFNFVNRIVLGLGVEYTEEEVKGYKY